MRSQRQPIDTCELYNETTSISSIRTDVDSSESGSLFRDITWQFSIDEQAIKNGPESDGSTNSPGVGEGTIEIDTATQVVTLDLSWSGLIGELTKLHIHGPATSDQSNPQHLIEIFGPPDLPAELVSSSGSWTDSFELKTLIQPGFDPIEPAFVIDTFVSGQAYLNVHSTVFGTGEIRGNLGIPIPEPNAITLLLIGIPALGRCRRIKHKPRS